MYNKNNIDSYFLFVEANQNAGRARKTTLIVEPCCIKEECCFQLGRSTETVCVCWEIEAISNPRYFFRQDWPMWAGSLGSYLKVSRGECRVEKGVHLPSQTLCFC